MFVRLALKVVIENDGRLCGYNLPVYQGRLHAVSTQRSRTTSFGNSHTRDPGSLDAAV